MFKAGYVERTGFVEVLSLSQKPNLGLSLFVGIHKGPRPRSICSNNIESSKPDIVI
jgi:hypothetical protein